MNGAELLYEGASLVHHSDHNRTGVSREVLNDLRETEHSTSPAHGLDRGSVWTAAQNGSGALVYEAFGVFGSALQEKIGVFHESSKNDTENSKCIVGGAAAAVSDATERGQQRPPSTARRPQQPLNE